MYIYSFKNSQKVKINIRKVVNICGLPSDDFLLKQVSFDYYYPRTYSNFIHGKIIFKKLQ